VYDKLSQIAPVVAWETAPGNDSWEQLTLNVARPRGREADGEALVEETEAAVGATRAASPALEGKGIGIFNFVEVPYVISSRDDSSIKFFESLGMVLPPQIESAPGSDARAVLSLENLDPLDADVLIGTSGDGTLDQLEESTLFKGLDVVQRDAYLSLDIGAATSMAFPSALSVQWALDNVVPDVVEAAAR
jgi:iron complex transport system substrate-binding protein